MPIWGWVVLGLANIPLYLLVGRLFFKDFEDFGGAIGFLLTPDIFSAFSGEFWEDWWAELKLFLFAAVCGLLVWVEGAQIVIPYLLPMFN